MPRARISHSFDSPSVEVFVDMGHPFLNRTVDGALKIGLVGVTQAALQETFTCLRKESLSKHDIESGVKKMATEGLQWGVIAGIYTGMEYGMQEVRGKHDWKNAMLGGALTGAILTIAETKHSRDKMVRSAITGGAIATAAEILTHLL